MYRIEGNEYPLCLLQAGAECDVFAEGGEDGLAVFAVRGGEQHAVGLEAAHLAGGEVGDDDDVAADQFFGGVPLGDAGEDLALFVAEIDFEAEELVGLGDALGDEDAGDAEIDLDEVVDGDLRGVWVRLTRRRWGECVSAIAFMEAVADSEEMGDSRNSVCVWAGLSTSMLTWGSAAGSAGLGALAVSMSVMIWMSPLSARGKMGESGPSLVPGLRPPHWRSLSSPLRAASSMSPRPSWAQTLAVA